jgi:hypothetical protein
MTGADEPYIVEFVQMGGSVKVSAIDPVTGTEVSIVGPASAGRVQLERTAVRKLEYVIAKKHGGDGDDGAGGSAPPRRGRVV